MNVCCLYVISHMTEHKNKQHKFITFKIFIHITKPVFLLVWLFHHFHIDLCGQVTVCDCIVICFRVSTLEVIVFKNVFERVILQISLLFGQLTSADPSAVHGKTLVGDFLERRLKHFVSIIHNVVCNNWNILVYI